MKNKLKIIFDFDGVLTINNKEPLISSLASLRQSYPRKKEIQLYLNSKKNIASITDLYKFIKTIRKLEINLSQFKSILFKYRASNITNKTYINFFKPTIFLFILKFIKGYFSCCILTSRDIPTIEMFLKKYKISNIKVLSSSNFKKKISNNKGFIID